MKTLRRVLCFIGGHSPYAVITSIRITNPGRGYTEPPTVEELVSNRGSAKCEVVTACAWCLTENPEQAWDSILREAIRQLLTPGHWMPTLHNIRHGNWWPNAFLNALPSCVFLEPIKLGWGHWDSYWP